MKIGLVTGIVAAVALVGVAVSSPAQVHAACAAPSPSYGTDTVMINIPTAGTYRIWSRILAPDTTNNSYQLDIDNSTCGIVVGDSSSIPASSWTWVDYQNGTTNSKINVTLSAGNHTLLLSGREPSVKVDRIIATTDTSCVPSGTGDNCVTATTGSGAGATGGTPTPSGSGSQSGSGSTTAGASKAIPGSAAASSGNGSTTSSAPTIGALFSASPTAQPQAKTANTPATVAKQDVKYKVGIGIGAVVTVVLAAGTFFFLRWRSSRELSRHIAQVIAPRLPHE